MQRQKAVRAARCRSPATTHTSIRPRPSHQSNTIPPLIHTGNQDCVQSDALVVQQMALPCAERRRCQSRLRGEERFDCGAGGAWWWWWVTGACRTSTCLPTNRTSIIHSCLRSFVHTAHIMRPPQHNSPTSLDNPRYATAWQRVCKTTPPGSSWSPTSAPKQPPI